MERKNVLFTKKQNYSVMNRKGRIFCVQFQTRSMGFSREKEKTETLRDPRRKFTETKFDRVDKHERGKGYSFTYVRVTYRQARRSFGPTSGASRPGLPVSGISCTLLSC